MCGIIGTTTGTEEALRDALSQFIYRGPDATGVFTDPSMHLGHARLSVIDLDPRSNQPFFDHTRKLAIVYNGEIYNYKELQQELAASGVSFRTTSDTEVLLEGYRTWGVGVLERLRGMFAFGIYDLSAGTILLARDHAGIKPLYYSIEGGQLRFASELKGVVALLRADGREPAIDPDAVGAYAVCGYVPSPQTLIRGIQKIERSSWLRYDLRTKTSETGTWKPRTREIRTTEDLEAAVKRSIIEHCVADVPVGTFFSGGVDSSLITAVLNAERIPVETFSIRVKGRPADSPYFNAIARHLGVKATVADFDEGTFEELYEPIFSRMDDPIADPSIFPTTFVARLAASKVKAVLSGEGGDELFIGYPRLKRLAAMRARYRTAPPGWNEAFFATPPFKGKTRLFSAWAASLGAPAAYYLLQVSTARDLSPKDAWKRMLAMAATNEGIWLDRDWYLENMLLRKTDMATSYASIEGRVPLLGPELWNGTPAFTQENLRGGTKAVLKDMLARYVPRELIDRPKAGFGISISTLLRTSPAMANDLSEALQRARDLGLSVPRTDLLAIRYPVYAFGLVALNRALRNLGLS